MKYIYLLLILLPFTFTIAQSPPMVWIDEDGGERNEYVYFRKDLKLEDTPSSATINLYADSRYALYINQVYIGFGPARTFHAHPTYDSYDISGYLKKGENTIAVKVLSNGMVTYQLFDYKGGFTAWGSIQNEKESIDLSISNDWLCKKSESYDQTAARFSFATGAIENLDTRKDINWNGTSSSTKDWKKPVTITDQKTWGTLTPRTIPHLTQKEVIASELIGAYTLGDSEDLYSFRIPTEDNTPVIYNQMHSAISYTYIYSPDKMEVVSGVWWGEYYLNGNKVNEQKEQNNSSYRKDYILELNKGWNLFVSRHGVIWGSWDFNLALPTDKDLVLSPTKTLNSKDIFKSYGPLKKLENNVIIDQLDLTQDIAKIKKTLDDSKLSFKWESQNRNKTSNHPARDLAWNKIDFDNPISIDNDLSNTIKLEPQTKGTSLIYDMGKMQLGRIFIEGDFEDGTIIDIGFSEEKNAKGTPWLYKRYQVGAGHRFIASKAMKRYETFKPYGARYLQLNIMNTKTSCSLDKIGMVRQVYPFKTIGSFKCSDPLLNKIWEAGWTTLQLCAEDTYTDTPFRERGLYAGDMLPEGAITMAVSGDTRLLKHSLHVFQDMYYPEMHEIKENLHGDFPLITLITLDHYLEYTGDWAFAKKHYNNYKSLLKNYSSRKNKEGLFQTKQVFIEWTDLNKHNAAMTALQAVSIKCLRVLTGWATKLGHKEDANFFKKEADSLTLKVNTILWDDKNHKFWDGIKNDSLISEQHLTSSIWPALYDVVDESRKKQIIEMLKQEAKQVITGHRQNKIAPYSSFYLFSLLYQAGESGIAEAFMKKHWGPMALHSGTSWENFSIGGNEGTSSHAWSGHPTYFLSSEVLGVNLGFYKTLDREVINIEPQSATLTWAEGSVAHPLGKVDVSWRVEGDRLILNYDAPTNAKVIINPKGRLALLNLWVNGVSQ